MWPFRGTKRPRVDPHQHHPFDEPSDAGMAAAVSGGMAGGVNSPFDIGVTAAFQRPNCCVVPGCGKFHEDPIHMPADE